MSQIKELQPQEGVTLLAVKVLEGVTNVHLGKGVDDRPFLGYDHDSHRTFDIVELPEYAFCSWQLLGIATEIAEEVWQGIVDIQLVDDRFGGLKYPNFNLKSKPHLSLDTATEAGMSFLEANEVYSVNPYGNKEPNVKIFEIHSEIPTRRYLWQQAEANTGTWVILMKQND